MTNQDKVKGSASYFPSIEKTYGFPIKHWMDLLKKQKQLKHMEMVAFLKTEHGFGMDTPMHLLRILEMSRGLSKEFFRCHSPLSSEWQALSNISKMV